jgi:tetratricopeptide (TPR) repeat protein
VRARGASGGLRRPDFKAIAMFERAAIVLAFAILAAQADPQPSTSGPGVGAPSATAVPMATPEPPGARPTQSPGCDTLSNLTARDVRVCTRLMQTHPPWDRQQFGYRFVRGYANRTIGAYDAGIADFTIAIRMYPKFADSYIQRGSLYAFEGRDRLAIADFDAAIARRRTFDNAFLERGNVYLSELDFRKAFADYRTAAQLRPYNGGAIFGAGIAVLELGYPPAAATNFSAALRVFPMFTIYTSGPSARNGPGEFFFANTQHGSPAGIDPRQGYAVIFLHIARSRSGGGDAREFARGVATLDPAAWPIPIVRLFAGTETEAAAIAAAERSAPALRRGEVCEATTYAGEYALLRHNGRHARRLFERAIERCPRQYLAYQLARSEIARSSARAPNR